LRGFMWRRVGMFIARNAGRLSRTFGRGPSYKTANKG
jgi:hypothetical protein